jgi:hypothetical protein
MNTYLLLRNNKESGPYSFEQLVQLGFKPYDLVWIVDKSAAWRYAGEIEELKAYAPAAEEQPYDRFYKKKSGEKKEETSVTQKSFPSPSVCITLPGQVNQNIIKEETNHVETRISIIENPVATRMKYIEPVEEMKETYIKNLQERKQKKARKKIYLQRLKKASVFIYMVALGMVIGFTIKSNQGKKTPIADQKTIQPSIGNKGIISTVAPEHTSAETALPKPVAKENHSTDPQVYPEKKQDQTNKKEPNIIINEPEVQEKKYITESSITNLETNSNGTERIKKYRGEKQENKTNLRDEIFKKVTVESNDYKRGLFGGIRDLQLTVVNKSDILLDDVTVELQYIKANELPLRTESILFHSIAPQGSQTISIPPSSRGVKVTYKITHIESKELNTETAGL